jgi:hypothetical protein
MSSRPRAFALLISFGVAIASTQCTELTKVDWSAIPPPSSGGAVSGSAGTSGAAGAENPSAGEGGASGEAGFAGEAGLGGSGVPETGGGGATSGGGGVGGVGGVAGGAGIAGGAGTGTVAGAGGALVHPTCGAAPTQGVAGAANLAAALTNAIVFFDGGAGGNGNRNGRAGLNDSCAKAKMALNLPQAQSAAVISVSGTDDILHMPETYKIPRQAPHVVSPLGIEFAKSWDAVWLAAPPSLVCTGVMPVGTKTWLSGTNKVQTSLPGEPVNSQGYGLYDFTQDSAGMLSNNTCDGWTLDTDDPNTLARVGSAVADADSVTDPRFFFYLLFSCDAADSHILCAAFDPTP